jgi:hypothetical protein
LSAYEGTIVTISHDRYFLDRVATQILALDGAGNAEHYDGDYTEYHDWKLGLREAAPAVKMISEENLVTVAPPVVQHEEPRPAKKPAPPAPKKPGVKVVKKKKETRTMELVESDIARAEQRLNEISEQMGKPEVARDFDKLIALNNEYHQTENSLRNLYEEWDRVTEQSAVAPGQSSQ